MDKPESEDDTEWVEFCHKKNRPCSKVKGHSGKCNSKRKLEPQHQFWLKSPRSCTQSEKENVPYETLQQTPESEGFSSAAERQEQTPVTEMVSCTTPARDQETATERRECHEQMFGAGGWAPALSSQTTGRVPLCEYKPCVQQKRKHDVEQLFNTKQVLEAEVYRLKQEAAHWEAERLRFEKEVLAWHEAQASIARRLEQVSQEEEKLRQEKERLNTWQEELEAWDGKVRKVLEQKGYAKTKVDQNPTTIDMMKSQSDVWYKRRRTSRECLGVINGGRNGAKVATFGVLVELASHDELDHLLTEHKNGKFYTKKLNSITAKYEASQDNIHRSLATKFGGDLSRRKYQLYSRNLSSVYNFTRKAYLPQNTYIDGISFRQSRLVSSSKLQAVIESIDIGEVHPLPGDVGATRDLVSLTHMITYLWLKVPELRSELRWFRGKEYHFIFIFADDGTPETQDSSIIVGTLSCWNFGKRVRSSATQYLLHLANASEKSEVGTFLWARHTEQAEWLESRSHTIAGIVCTFEFRAGGDESWAATALGETTGAATFPCPWAIVSKHDMFIVGGKIGVTWMPWTNEQRYRNAEKVEEFLSSQPAGLSESVLRNRRNSFMAENGIRSICPPRIGKYAATFCPDPLHTETNAAQQLLNVLYQEAVKRNCVERVTDVMRAPISLPKARNEPVGGKYEGKSPSTVSLEAAADRTRHNEGITEQCDKLKRQLDAFQPASDPGKNPSLVGLNMKAIADKILEHDANKSTRHTKIKNVRLIGENAICLERYFYRLVDALEVPNEGEPGKIRRLVIGKLGQLLRDAAAIFNQHEIDEPQLNELEGILDTYFDLFCLFLSERGNLTVFTVAKSIPYYARQLYDEYGAGYGVVSMQGKEAKNAKVKEYLKLTNRSKEAGKSNKYFQVFRQEYIKEFYLQEHNPSPSQYRPHFNPRVPSQVGTPGYCDCGREIVRSDVDSLVEDEDEDEDEEQVSLCAFCVDALEVVACAKEGELSQKMLDILLPAVCQVCGLRFEHVSALDSHKAEHSTTGDQTEHLQANEVSSSAVMVPQTMRKRELIAELRKRGKSIVGNLPTLRVRLEKALRP